MFTIFELLKATSGKLINGRSSTFIKGVSIDSRTIKKGELFIAIRGNRYDAHSFVKEAIKRGARGLIVERPVKIEKDIPVILVKDSARSLGDIAHFHRRRFLVPVIAVTGSNGKTTTKDMIACLLGSKFKVLKNIGTRNNQVGLALTLLKLNKTYRIVVLELGTNHFGEIKRLSQIARPNLGLILNIGTSHLEFLKDLKSVYKEKYELIKNLRFPRIAILNKDDYFLRKHLKGKAEIITISFGISYKSDFFVKKITRVKNRLCFRLNQGNLSINSPGLFNAYNAIAAIACVRLFGIDYSSIRKKLSQFRFPAGRLKIRRIKGITFIDDSYNANPLSLGGALQVLKDIKPAARKIIVLGDMLELGRRAGYFHNQAGRQISKICDIIITVGNLSRLAAKAAKMEGFPKASIFSCASSREAKEILYSQVRPGEKDVVLLKGSRRMKIEEIIK